MHVCSCLAVRLLKHIYFYGFYFLSFLIFFFGLFIKEDKGGEKIKNHRVELLLLSEMNSYREK